MPGCAVFCSCVSLLSAGILALSFLFPMYEFQYNTSDLDIIQILFSVDWSTKFVDCRGPSGLPHKGATQWCTEYNRNYTDSISLLYIAEHPQEVVDWVKYNSTTPNLLPSLQPGKEYTCPPFLKVKVVHALVIIGAVLCFATCVVGALCAWGKLFRNPIVVRLLTVLSCFPSGVAAGLILEMMFPACLNSFSLWGLNNNTNGVYAFSLGTLFYVLAAISGIQFINSIVSCCIQWSGTGGEGPTDDEAAGLNHGHTADYLEEKRYAKNSV